jgi:ATP phosphoribosyltransferase regulatory subunit
MSKQQLLPLGFYDLIFDQALQNHRNINKILDVFFANSYSLIKTSLLEFANNFSASDINNSFFTTDVFSGQNLVMRSDITLQISRLLASKLKDYPLPLKLCYVGDVFCTKNNDLYPDRQQTQLGIEIIGSNSIDSQFDVLQTTLDSLACLNLQNLSISISLPDFIDVFLAKINNPQDLKQAITQKNISKIKTICPDFAEIITILVLENQDLKQIINKLGTISCPNINQQLQIIQATDSFLQQKFPHLHKTYDIFGDDHFNYHQNIAFDIFCGNFAYAIAKGGCYQLQDQKMAVGSTIYANHLQKILCHI